MCCVSFSIVAPRPMQRNNIDIISSSTPVESINSIYAIRMNAIAHSLVNLSSSFDRTASPSPYPSDEISTICAVSLLSKLPSNNQRHCVPHSVCAPIPHHPPCYPSHIHRIPRFGRGISFYNASAIVISIGVDILEGSSVRSRRCDASIPS